MGRGYSFDFWKANLMNLLLMMGQAVFFLLNLYLAQSGMSKTRIGICEGVFWLVSVLIQPWLGRQLDRVGRKPFFVWGAWLMVLSSLGYLLAPPVFGVILVLRAIQGIGFSWFFTASWTWVSDQAPPQRLTEMLGVFGIASLLAGACGPVLSEQLYDHSGGFVLVFQVALALILASALIAPFVHEAPHLAHTSERRGPGFFRLATAGRMRALTLACLAMGMTIGAVFGFIAIYVKTRQITGMGYLFLCYTVAAVATRLFAGAAARWIGAAGLVAVALTLQAGSLIAFSHLTPTGWSGFPLMLISGAAAGLAYGLIYPALSALAVERSGSYKGLGMSVVACFGDLGSALGGFGAGTIADYIDLDWAFFAVGCVVAASALIFLLLEASWKARRRRRPRSVEGPSLRLVSKENRLG